MARNTGSAEPRQTNTDQMAKAETEDIYEGQKVTRQVIT